MAVFISAKLRTKVSSGLHQVATASAHLTVGEAAVGTTVSTLSEAAAVLSAHLLSHRRAAELKLFSEAVRATETWFL